MTHTLHRRGTQDNLDEDYVILCMAAKGINEVGSVEKMREFLRICLSYGPINIGDMRTGNIYNACVDDLFENVTSTSIVHAVFTDKGCVTNVLRTLKDAHLGMSVVVSGIFSCVSEISKEVGLKPHSVDYSLGIWGRKDMLPPDNILEVTTMCGHAMVSPNLVISLVNGIKRKMINVEEASEQLTKICECGIFNPMRASELLRKLVANC